MYVINESLTCVGMPGKLDCQSKVNGYETKVHLSKSEKNNRLFSIVLENSDDGEIFSDSYESSYLYIIFKSNFFAC